MPDATAVPVLRTSRRRRRTLSWVRVTLGSSRSHDDADPVLADLHAWQAVLGDEVRFTGLTAARIRGWWLPPLPDDLPVFAATVGTARPRRPGLVVSRHGKRADAELVDGLRVDRAALTLLACARVLSVLDLVVLVDAALHAGDCTVADLAAAAASGGAGSVRLREAVARADGRSESAWETLLRELHRVCGVEVVPQHVVADKDGVFIARGDLLVVGTRTLHEYDGEHHLARKRQRQDLSRTRRLGHAGFERRGYTSEDVLHQPIGILRDADASLGREHDPARVRGWYDELRDSLFTPAGTAAFRMRNGLPPPPSPGQIGQSGGVAERADPPE
jgi:very-short-patch-repair endonuclease